MSDEKELSNATISVDTGRITDSVSVAQYRRDIAERDAQIAELEAAGDRLAGCIGAIDDTHIGDVVVEAWRKARGKP